jgi:hypothetical protein
VEKNRNGAAVDAELLDGLPLDAKLDAGRFGLKGVLQKLSGPLVVAAGFEHPVNEVRSANDVDLHVRPRSLGIAF